MKIYCSSADVALGTSLMELIMAKAKASSHYFEIIYCGKNETKHCTSF